MYWKITLARDAQNNISLADRFESVNSNPWTWVVEPTNLSRFQWASGWLLRNSNILYLLGCCPLGRIRWCRTWMFVLLIVCWGICLIYIDLICAMTHVLHIWWLTHESTWLFTIVVIISVGYQIWLTIYFLKFIMKILFTLTDCVMHKSLLCSFILERWKPDQNTLLSVLKSTLNSSSSMHTHSIHHHHLYLFAYSSYRINDHFRNSQTTISVQSLSNTHFHTLNFSMWMHTFLMHSKFIKALNITV